MLRRQISDSTLLKIIRDVRRGLSRSAYEELLIELNLATYDQLTSRYEYGRLTKSNLIRETVEMSVLKNLYESKWGFFGRKTLDALEEDGIVLKQERQAPAPEEPTVSVVSLPDYQRQSLESRRAKLIEEHKAASAQLNRELSDVNRTRLMRQISDIESQIEKIDSKLSKCDFDNDSGEE